jgi:hypothetical protein
LNPTGCTRTSPNCKRPRQSSEASKTGQNLVFFYDRFWYIKDVTSQRVSAHAQRRWLFNDEVKNYQITLERLYKQNSRGVSQLTLVIENHNLAACKLHRAPWKRVEFIYQKERDVIIYFLRNMVRTWRRGSGYISMRCQARVQANNFSRVLERSNLRFKWGYEICCLWIWRAVFCSSTSDNLIWFHLWDLYMSFRYYLDRPI